MRMPHPEDDEDHTPHMYPVDPVIVITRLDIALAVGIAVLTVLWLALA